MKLSLNVTENFQNIEGFIENIEQTIFPPLHKLRKNLDAIRGKVQKLEDISKITSIIDETIESIEIHLNDLKRYCIKNEISDLNEIGDQITGLYSVISDKLAPIVKWMKKNSWIW